MLDQTAPVGKKALVIRSFRGEFATGCVDRPTLSVYVRQVYPDGSCYCDVLLTPPEDVRAMNEGDRVQMDLEWMTYPASAASYYGPDQAFRECLETQNAWQIVHREARGNQCPVEVVRGGTLLCSYPVILELAEGEESLLELRVQGGVGVLPVRVDRLRHADYCLCDDRGILFSEFYQLDHQEPFFSLACNIPIDDLPPGKTTLFFKKK